MNKRAMAMGALLVLAGCGSGGEQADGEASTGGGGSGVGAAASMQPGQWELTTQMVSMNIPGAPAGAAQQTPPNTSKRCIKGNDAQEIANSFSEASPDQCPTREFSMTGGRMQGRIVCSQDGNESSTTLTGDYTAKSFDMRIEQKTPSAPGQTATVVMRSTGRWMQAECSAEEDGDAEL